MFRIEETFASSQVTSKGGLHNNRNRVYNLISSNLCNRFVSWFSLNFIIRKIYNTCNFTFISLHVKHTPNARQMVHISFDAFHASIIEIWYFSVVIINDSQELTLSCSCLKQLLNRFPIWLQIVFNIFPSYIYIVQGFLLLSLGPKFEFGNYQISYFWFCWVLPINYQF